MPPTHTLTQDCFLLTAGSGRTGSLLEFRILRLVVLDKLFPLVFACLNSEWVESWLGPSPTWNSPDLVCVKSWVLAAPWEIGVT